MLRYVALASVMLGCLPITGRSPAAMADDSNPVCKFGSSAAHASARFLYEELWAKGRFKEAKQAAASGLEAMRGQGRLRAAVWYLNILGGSCFRTGDLRGAMDAYVQGRDAALRLGMPTDAATALSNLSSLYLHVNDADSALVAAEEAVGILVKGKYWEERSQALLQLGRVLLARKAGKRAAPLFARVIQEAPDPGLKAAAWDLLGFELAEAGDYSRAEEALVNAFRVRKLARSPALFSTEQKLAKVYLGLGRVDLARPLIDAAFEDWRGSDDQVPSALMYITRAGIRRAEGDLQGSLEDSVRAVQCAEQRWRARGPSADALRIGADISLEKKIYSSAVESAAELFRRTHDLRYAEIAWELCERNRSASLRQTVASGSDWIRRVPDGYWKLLARLRDLEAAELGSRRQARSGGDEAVRIRMRLSEMESAAATKAPVADSLPAKEGVDTFVRGKAGNRARLIENFSDRIPLTNFRRTLGLRRKFVAFLLAEPVSYRWVIDGRSIDLRFMAGKRELADSVGRMRRALEAGSPDAERDGEQLYRNLFEGIDNGGVDHWDVALDEDLFDLPLAGLVCARNRDGLPVYLIERRTIQITPGAWAVGDKQAVTHHGVFAGIGDGIYNVADPRYRGSASIRNGWLSFVPPIPFAAAESPQFTTLAGSREELRRVSGIAGGPAVLLTGAELNRAGVLATLNSGPRLVHIAAHFVEQRNGEPAVVLGLRPNGMGKAGLELLTARDIASLQIPGAVVVLSGCSSGAGRVVPSAGVLGLARAWLSAGARAVVTTHWPTTDGTGDLFERFYRYLSTADEVPGVTPAEALRRAQVDMLRSGGKRSEARYWAAYQMVGRST